LGSVLIAQDFLPEHWNWANTDLVTLGDIEKMGNVIKTRLENGWCKISEMYAVKHDKDESKLWNEYTMTYDVKFTWQTKDSAVSNIFKRRKYVVYWKVWYDIFKFS